jgi:CxxC motif-containing protein (DUF1111 family)
VIQERATPLLQAEGVFREQTPPGAAETSNEVAPLLFGLGLVESIPDETILSRADPEDNDGDGISGRPGLSLDGRLGRFTRKGGIADLLEQSASAASTDLGLTSHFRPDEQSVNGLPLPPGVDPAPDPELTEAILSLITDFVRYLAPPARESPTNAAVRDTLARGEALFLGIGCAGCHTPSMETGPSGIEAVDRKTIFLYSDLLLHDLGPGYRTVCSGQASPTEFKTARLQGLRLRYPVAQQVLGLPGLERRILQHGGEAQGPRDAFEALGLTERRSVLRFLESI